MTNKQGDYTYKNSLEEKKLIRIEQDRMAMYLYSSYENVKKIKFTSFDKNIVTGTWTANAEVNDTIYVTFGIYHIGKNEEISFGQHINQSGEQELVKKTERSHNVNADGVEIIYFMGGN